MYSQSLPQHRNGRTISFENSSFPAIHPHPESGLGIYTTHAKDYMPPTARQPLPCVSHLEEDGSAGGGEGGGGHPTPAPPR
jgi:hypothetical protein